MKGSNVLVAVIGALLAVLGFYVYQQASDVIAVGDSYWGLGWLFIDEISAQEADAYQMGGIAAMVVGGILVVVGVVRAVRS